MSSISCEPKYTYDDLSKFHVGDHLVPVGYIDSHKQDQYDTYIMIAQTSEISILLHLRKHQIMTLGNQLKIYKYEFNCSITKDT
jgi:hypothetical protein